MDSLKPLIILSWNTAGWSAKFQDSAFINYIAEFDILLFQETWLENHFHISEYKSLSLREVPGTGCGELHGGLNLQISTKLHANITQLDPMEHYAMAY